MSDIPLPDTLDELHHWGVKGMRWGIRKDNRAPGVSRKTNREAAKDASEFTKAKMFYGEGAGNRRKLINATIKSKSRDATYKKALDFHIGKTDMAKRASQARSERSRKDTRAATAKTARGIKNTIAGNMRYASLAGAVIGSGLLYARQTGIDRVVAASAKQAYSTVKRDVQSGNTKRRIEKLLRDLKIK